MAEIPFNLLTEYPTHADALREIERLRNMIREYVAAETASWPPDDRETYGRWVQRSEDAWNAIIKEARRD